jgi:hypothetical protein
MSIVGYMVYGEHALPFGGRFLPYMGVTYTDQLFTGIDDQS